MRIVLTDTGPLNYLVLIDEADVLRALFGGVSIPEAVADELSHPAAPASVRTWMTPPPAWLSLHPDMGGGDDTLQRLGAGERETILLGVATQAALILMDDRAGVVAARAKGLSVIGTLGVIDLAARRGLLDPSQAAARLRATNFRCRPQLFQDLLDRHRGA